MSAKPKKRITNCKIGELEMPVDADEQWEQFIKSDEIESLETIGSHFFWSVQLPWIDQSLDVRESFWKAYSGDSASKARSVAIFGVKYSNDSELLNLLNDAITLERNRKAGKFKGAEGRKKFDRDAQWVALKFSEIAEKKDPKIFRRMAGLLESGGITLAHEVEGDTINRSVLKHFISLLKTRRELPTKKELRLNMGWQNGTDSDIEKLRRSIKELGLNGLPES